jgi:hypothetical protein
MTFSITISKKLAAIALGLATAAAATTAVAAWLASGGGDASAKAGTFASLTLADASAGMTGDLFPGGAGDLKLKVTNPNSFAVTITTVSLQSGGSITSNVAACTTGGTGVSFTNQTGLSLALAAGATTTFTLDDVVAMSSASHNSCQGALFTIPVEITATT